MTRTAHARSQPADDSTVVVARQPILNADKQVISYELLYRRPGAIRADVTDDAHATTDMLVSAFIDIGLGVLTHGLPAFINVEERFLLSGAARALPADRVVLEILETTRITPDLVAVIEGLRADGYVFALDDYVWTEETARLIPLVEIIKVDVLDRSPAEIAQDVRRYRHPDLRLLAEKVEDESAFTALRDLGFELFQGFFFARPDRFHGQRLRIHQASRLALVSLLSREDADLREAIAAIKRDAALCAKVLRLINSSFYTLVKPVQTIDRAVKLLGLNAVLRWAGVGIVLDSRGTNHENSRRCLMRARLCEHIAENTGHASPGSAFMVGLLSCADALFNLPLEQALSSVAIAPDIRDALLHRRGPHGHLLTGIEAFERGAWDDATVLPLPLSTISTLYADVAAWVREVEQAS